MLSSEKAKSEMVTQLVRLARKEHLSYDEFGYICQQARKKLKLRKPKREQRLPQLLTSEELGRFFQAVREGGRVEHEIILKLLFFTAVRVGELVKIEVNDVDLAACKIFVDQGKGSKDRYLLFPQTFSLVLRAHLAAHPKQMYLFETQRCGPYTVRRVQQIVQRYRETAGLSASVHPHLFRHQMLTFLTGQKLSDAQIQLLSGHASKKSLEVYQHLSLDAVDAAYQQAVRFIDL
ncbi:tyrosine-type recombinase/integrase [Deinococcus saxicola]|uniref:tyrosine-type recombinase/integrase n=1 Tax=Deinococcus saxicola TaxID=249406 RepID=UPI0039F01922